MCYIDQDDNLIVNRKFARLVGMNIAAYWAIMITILKQVKLKNRMNQDTGEFRVDRKYIERELGITPENQREYDIVLHRLGIVTGVNPENKDKLIVDSKRYYEIITDSNLIPEDFIPKSLTLSKAEKTAAKKEGIAERVLLLFEETDSDLLTAYKDLVEVFVSKGIYTNAEWRGIINLINTTAPTKSEKLELVNFAITTGWRSFNAVVDAYTKQRKPTAGRINKPQVTVTKINSEVKF